MGTTTWRMYFADMCPEEREAELQWARGRPKSSVDGAAEQRPHGWTIRSEFDAALKAEQEQEERDIEQLDEKQNQPPILQAAVDCNAANDQHEEADGQQVHGCGADRAGGTPVVDARGHEHQTHENVEPEACLSNAGAAEGAAA